MLHFCESKEAGENNDLGNHLSSPQIHEGAKKSQGPAAILSLGPKVEEGEYRAEMRSDYRLGRLGRGEGSGGPGACQLPSLPSYLRWEGLCSPTASAGGFSTSAASPRRLTWRPGGGALHVGQPLAAGCRGQGTEPSSPERSPGSG